MAALGSTGEYVHGYTSREAQRLADQANTLTRLLHHDSVFPPGSLILEPGCGVGAQTVTLAGQNPQCRLISCDLAGGSVASAKKRMNADGLSNADFLQANIRALPFRQGCFDHVFVCFVLEHLSDPVSTLALLKSYLRPGGAMTIIEGDHGSVYFWPDSPRARRAIECQVELQHRRGGDANIGRRLYPLLASAGFEEVSVSPRMVYVDSSRPELVEGFTLNTFTAMIEGIRDDAIAAGLISPRDMDEGIADLHRTSEPDGTFCYTFFKARGLRP